MERTHLHRLLLASVLVFGLSTAARGAQLLSVAKPGADSNPPLAKFYAGSTVNVGEFPGTLVRLSCDSGGNSNAKARRHESGPDYALVVQGDGVMHPLFPGTDEVRRQLNSLDEQETAAAVYGKYYPSTGAILVSRVMITNPAARTDEALRELRGVSTAELPAAREGLRLAQCSSH